MTVTEAAAKWGVNRSWVKALVLAGRIPDAELVDAPVPWWRLPDDATLPPRKIRARKAGARGQWVKASEPLP